MVGLCGVALSNKEGEEVIDENFIKLNIHCRYHKYPKCNGIILKGREKYELNKSRATVF